MEKLWIMEYALTNSCNSNFGTCFFTQPDGKGCPASGDGDGEEVESRSLKKITQVTL